MEFTSASNFPDPAAITRAMKVVMSHLSAAGWLGADLPFAVRDLHVTAARNRGRRSDCMPGIQLHRSDLADDEILVVRGVPVTTPARTLLDLARSMPLEQAVAVGDRLCRRGGLAPQDAVAAAMRLPRGKGRPAAVRAASLLDVRAESLFESITRVRLIVAGLPAPTPQLTIYSSSGERIGRVDFAWEAQRVVLECDGYEYHADRAAFERDRRRWSALTRAGWLVVVVTWRDVIGDPAYLVSTMTDVLAGA